MNQEQPNKIESAASIISQSEKKLPVTGIRHVQYLLLFLGATILYAFRVNLSVAIVAMTDKNETIYDTFDWDQTKKSLILSSFYWGYLVNQIPGGQISKKYGAKYTIMFAILSSSILTLITPILTTLLEWEALIVIRFSLGIVQGCAFPSILTFISKWAPINERPRVTFFIYSGTVFGTFLMMALSGVISSNFGWSSIFYLSGGVGLIWTIIWQILSASTPAQHRKIQLNERAYIQESLSHTEITHKEYIPTPWFEIFTSLPFLSATLVQCCQSYGSIMFLTESPIYFNGVFNLPIEKNALLSSLPDLGALIMNYVFIGLEYVICRYGLFKVSVTRKLFATIGNFAPAIALIFLSLVSKDHLNLAVLVIVITKSLSVVSIMTIQVNFLELSSNHAGTLMGISQLIAGIFGILSPLVVPWIVADEHNQQQWQILFLIAAGFYLLGGMGFIIFGTTKTQNWNVPKKLEEKY